tara:strand:- start:766 stop:942 length:177 start_codon:yes stop_codon:yes gene_type:complete
MTVKEKQQIDHLLLMTSIASVRDAKARDLLVALAHDINGIRHGNKPTEINKLIDGRAQ